MGEEGRRTGPSKDSLDIFIESLGIEQREALKGIYDSVINNGVVDVNLEMERLAGQYGQINFKNLMGRLVSFQEFVQIPPTQLLEMLGEKLPYDRDLV